MITLIYTWNQGQTRSSDTKIFDTVEKADRYLDWMGSSFNHWAIVEFCEDFTVPGGFRTIFIKTKGYS